MNDDVENQQKEPTADDTGGPVAGERLAEARREQQISVHEVAKELHLDEPKVRALERNEFDILGAPVFAKGHLKKYAQLVGVNSDDVLTDYYQLTRAADLPPVISVRSTPRRELSPGPWIAVIVAIIIAVSAYWWFTSQPVTTEPEVPEQDLLSAESSDIVVPPSTDASIGVDPAPTDEEIVAVPEPEPEVESPVIEPTVEETTSPEIIAGQMRVLVTYTGDCWTEITDSSGRRLLFDLGKDGRTVELSGAEPFNALFGNPGNVSLRVNGEDYSLPPTDRPDRPMRLTISGS